MIIFRCDWRCVFLNNRKKSLINITSDLFYQLVTVLLGIIIPRLVLTNLGSEANGLISTLSQILSYVSLLEAGVGAASLQALFSPLQKDNKEDINSIVSATNFFYVRTGATYLVILILLACVFPITVNSEISKVSITGVVLVSGIPSAINFFFQGKYIIFLNANGKNYISKYIGTFVYIVNSVLKIIFLNLGFGIVAVQSLGIISSIIQVIYIEIYIHRNYKWIDLKEKKNFEAIKQSKNVLIHQVAWLVTSNTDTIILTYVCGLKTVSIYAMYRLLLGMIDKVIESITSGLHFVMGYYFQKSKAEYEQIYSMLEVTIIGLCFSLFCIAHIFILPFLQLYTSDVYDINYIDPILAMLFVIVHILIESRGPSWETISVAGYFSATQNQSVIEAIINLTISLLLVFKFGMYGVLVGTIIASTYRLIIMVEYSNRQILNRNPWPSYRRYFIGIIMFVITTAVLNIIVRFLNFTSYLKIFTSAIFCTIITVPLFFFALLIFERQTWKDAVKLLHFKKGINRK